MMIDDTKYGIVFKYSLDSHPNGQIWVSMILDKSDPRLKDVKYLLRDLPEQIRRELIQDLDVDPELKPCSEQYATMVAIIE